MKIAFVGSHGTGKSTASFKEASRLKCKYPSANIGLFTENARLCPLPINQSTTLESQLWIFCNQYQSELKLIQKYDILICDRSIYDCIAYAYYTTPDFADKLLDLCKIIPNTYDRIVFNTIENNDFLICDGIRATDVEYRQWIEDKLLKVLDEVGISYELN